MIAQGRIRRSSAIASSRKPLKHIDSGCARPGADDDGAVAAQVRELMPEAVRIRARDEPAGRALDAMVAVSEIAAGRPTVQRRGRRGGGAQATRACVPARWSMSCRRCATAGSSSGLTSTKDRSSVSRYSQRRASCCRRGLPAALRHAGTGGPTPACWWRHSGRDVARGDALDAGLAATGVAPHPQRPRCGSAYIRVKASGEAGIGEFAGTRLCRGTDLG